jgi:hypothetical protein
MNYSKQFVVEPGAEVKLHKKRRVSERRLAAERSCLPRKSLTSTQLWPVH